MANVLMKYTWPWAVGATVLVIGFMYWLYAETSSMESGLVVTEMAGEALPVVADTAYVNNPERFSSRRILLTTVTVEELLGRASLAVTVAEQAGYPVIMDRRLIDSVTVVPGDNLVLAGWVFALNDSILDVWAQRALYDPENREKLEGHATFFLVDSLDWIFPEMSEESGGPGS